MAQELTITEVHPNPDQPRRVFEQASIEDLAESIKQCGQIQPITVRRVNGGYQIVQGERRWRACKLAGLETIRAEVRELGDGDAYVLSVIENEQRENLSPMETARALKAMMDTQELTQAGVAKRISRSRSWVAQKLRLLNLPDDAQELVKDCKLSEAHARQLLKLNAAELSDRVGDLAESAANGGWSVSRLESEVDALIVGVEPETSAADVDPTVLAVRYAFYSGALCVLRHMQLALLENQTGAGVSCDTSEVS